MSSVEGKEAPKPEEGKGFRIPGLRGARTTMLFRAVNPELFIKPVRLHLLFYLFSLLPWFS